MHINYRNLNFDIRFEQDNVKVRDFTIKDTVYIEKKVSNEM
jgi:hypothetical protein